MCRKRKSTPPPVSRDMLLREEEEETTNHPRLQPLLLFLQHQQRVLSKIFIIIVGLWRRYPTSRCHLQETRWYAFPAARSSCWYDDYQQQRFQCYSSRSITRQPKVMWNYFSADDDAGMVVLLLLLYIPWEELNSNQNVFIFSWDIFVLGFLHLQSTKCTKTLYVASEKCFDENSWGLNWDVLPRLATPPSFSPLLLGWNQCSALYTQRF